ncbi:MAG: hypothetical protein PHP83_02555, partial [Clostridia bacterium]|nr:hypothetical protein [Clostridia bacterium]
MKSLIQKQIEENTKIGNNSFDNKGDSLMNNIAKKDKLLKVGLDELSNTSKNNGLTQADNKKATLKSKSKVSKFANKVVLCFMAASISFLASFGVAKILKNNNIFE